MHLLSKARAAFRPSLFLLLWAGLWGCSDRGLHAVAIRGETMGTYYNVKVVGERGELPDEARLTDWVDTEFKRINQSMSTYIGDSEISMLNRASAQPWYSVSEDLLAVLEISQAVSEASDGAFDITVMPLVDLWGFGPGPHDYTLPEDREIEQTLTRIGYQKLLIDADNLRVRRPDGVTIDLSAVAKGYGADAIGHLLAAKGYRNYLVEVGGELKLAGVSARGDAWRIGVEKPVYGSAVAGEQPPAETLALSDRGMATSGDYRNYYELDGKRYSHTIDPTTGRPISHKLASVSVVAKSCAEADAWATALNVLGPERGYRIAEEQNLAAYFIVGEGDGFEVRYTPAFEQYFYREDR